MTQQTTIFTVGHGTDSFDEFLARITPHGVSAVVDVRSQPTSRHAPDFRKRPLELAAASAGIGYRWLGGSLGGRPSDASLYIADGIPDWDRVREEPWFGGGVEELLAMAMTNVVAIMCSELDPRSCHRTLLIAPTLLERGVAVVDIFEDGSAAPHQPPLG